MIGQAVEVAPYVQVLKDVVQVGVVRDGERCLFIDFGSGEAATRFCEREGVHPDKVIVTHHHRDQAYGLSETDMVPAEVVAPETERPWFEDVDGYWADPKHRWHVYDFRPHRLMLTDPTRVSGVCRDQDHFLWGESEISILSTPGHTDGSVTVLVESGGRRIAFCGDTLCGEGQLWDLHSLQKGEKGIIGDYHGFMGARAELLSSLDTLEALKADVLVPSHGGIVTDPGRAISLLRSRLAALYEAYCQVSALRHYFPQLFTSESPGKVFGATATAPDFLRHIGTTWLILSEGRAFAIDCGSPDALRQVEALGEAGLFSGVDGLWISHYHDDHVDAIPAFVERYKCPVLTDDSVAKVVEDPMAWNLPCISPVKIHVDQRIGEGESWTWQEFKMTGFHLPGQTLYHSGLLVEGRGLRLFFAGDSFTPTGIDDYCINNRNFLGPAEGFERCMKLLKEIRPDWVFNNHVDVAFRFTPKECDIIQRNLKKRDRMLSDLLAREDPHMGMDENWVRVSPYESVATPGSRHALHLVIMRHDSEAKNVRFRPLIPRSWQVPAVSWSEARSQGLGETCLGFDVAIPPQCPAGRYVIGVDLDWDEQRLGPVTEFIVNVPGAVPAPLEAKGGTR